jgi:hypothetical protein
MGRALMLSGPLFSRLVTRNEGSSYNLVGACNCEFFWIPEIWYL